MGYEILIAILASRRLTSILHSEKIAEGIRSRIGIRGDFYPDTFLGNLFACFWCLSVWAGLLVGVVMVVDWRLLLPLALSEGAIILQDKIHDHR